MRERCGIHHIMVGYSARSFPKKFAQEIVVLTIIKDSVNMKKLYTYVKDTFFTLYPTAFERECKHVRDWRLRLKLETSHQPYIFFTLTYDNEHLPPFGIPNKHHIQAFFKRFRSRIDYGKKNVHIKYYVISEHGEDSDRLHYHGLLFGVPFSVDILRYFIDSWQFGRVDYRSGLPSHISYVTKYLHKRHGDSDRFLNLKSNGIGKSLLTDSFIERQRARKTNWIYWQGKREILPRYMMDKIFDKDDKEDIARNNAKFRFARDCKAVNSFDKPFAIVDGHHGFSDGSVFVCTNMIDKVRAYRMLKCELDIDRYNHLISN